MLGLVRPLHQAAARLDRFQGREIRIEQFRGAVGVGAEHAHDAHRPPPPNPYAAMLRRPATPHSRTAAVFMSVGALGGRHSGPCQACQRCRSSGTGPRPVLPPAPVAAAASETPRARAVPAARGAVPGHRAGADAGLRSPGARGVICTERPRTRMPPAPPKSRGQKMLTACKDFPAPYTLKRTVATRGVGTDRRGEGKGEESVRMRRSGGQLYRRAGL